MALYKSSEFKGIGFNYDPQQQPFFKAMVKENLRALSLLPTGKGILKAIRDLKPAHRVKQWPSGVNVMMQPPLTKTWNTPGLSGQLAGRITDQTKFDDFQKGKGRLIPGISSKTSLQEDNRTAASNGTGSVCTLFYSNTEILSDEGTWFIPHITMGHELIHCLHGLKGIMNPDNRLEEYSTVGIKGYENNIYSENKLRKEAGFPLRTKYFSDD